MRVILGLGNPGIEYSQTRHNCGFLVTDKIAAVFQVKLKKRCFHLYKKALCEDSQTILIQPLTYMNNSGEIVKDLDSFNVEDLVVICDQMDLPVGSIRIKRGGGTAGHNGLKSLIKNLDGRVDFIRVYVGIGRPSMGESVVDHVLGIEKDTENFNLGIQTASDAIKDLIEGKTIEDLMQKYNKKKVKA